MLNLSKKRRERRFIDLLTEFKDLPRTQTLATPPNSLVVERIGKQIKRYSRSIDFSARL
jgi:hypothetical protein